MKKYYTPKTKTISLEAEELLAAVSRTTVQSVWDNLPNTNKYLMTGDDENGWHITGKNGKDHSICIEQGWHQTPVMNGIIED